MAKYTYETVRIELRGGFGGMKESDDYRMVIQSYASDGWRLVQVFAPPMIGQGYAQFIDLIFEKEI